MDVSGSAQPIEVSNQDFAENEDLLQTQGWQIPHEQMSNAVCGHIRDD